MTEYILPEFRCSDDGFDVTDEVKKAFDHNGCIVMRNFLPPDELAALRDAFDSDPSIQENIFGRSDGEGQISRTTMWSKPSEDVPGVVLRSEKAAGTVEKLIGGEVYIYHIKINKKEPFTGGAFLWHQDYGYWYEDKNPMPRMGTLYIAVDEANRENGCLKLIPGSHHMGRLEHHTKGAQLEADVERVEWASRRLQVVHAELRAGDAAFFHCNMLHRSEQNRSPRSRFGYLCAYNRSDNSPLSNDGHGSAVFTEKMTKLPNSAILECGTKAAEKNYYHYNKKVTSFTRIRDRQMSKTNA